MRHRKKRRQRHAVLESFNERSRWKAGTLGIMRKERLDIINIVGVRPNFIKIAPLMAAYRKTDGIEPLLVHTGQHYDESMSRRFFEDLDIPEPDIDLQVGPASHAVQTAEIMKAFEGVAVKHRPDAVLVVGDVNSTIACGLVAAKLGIPLIHVEAGLRSGDRSMPEEINRILTDAISDLLFCTEQSGVDNLVREGVDPGKVFLVGNVMADTLLDHLERSKTSTVLDRLQLKPRQYAILTLHRPSNVDEPAVLAGILDALEKIQRLMPIIIPVHPRLRDSLKRLGLKRRFDAMGGLRAIDPLGYLDFLKLMSEARLVLTDSGGIQEETTILHVPCLTLRENTERPITVEVGSNRVVGTRTEALLEGVTQTLRQDISGRVPPLWDGKAAERIVAILIDELTRFA